MMISMAPMIPLPDRLPGAVSYRRHGTLRCGSRARTKTATESYR